MNVVYNTESDHSCILRIVLSFSRHESNLYIDSNPFWQPLIKAFPPWLHFSFLLLLACSHLCHLLLCKSLITWCLNEICFISLYLERKQNKKHCHKKDVRMRFDTLFCRFCSFSVLVNFFILWKFLKKTFEVIFYINIHG